MGLLRSAQELPNAELITLEGGDHITFLTRLDFIQPKIDIFLNKHAPKSI